MIKPQPGGNRFFSVGVLSLLLLADTSIVRLPDDSPRIFLRENTPVLALPESLTQYIKAKYPDLRVPGVEDMTSYWAMYLNKNTVPYACWGDFNGDGLTDVALILIGKQRWRFLAFHQSDEHGYESHGLERFPGPNRAFTGRPPQTFQIHTLEAGKKLMLGDAPVDSSQREFDSIVFLRSRDPSDGYLHSTWSTSHKFYGVSAVGGFTD